MVALVDASQLLLLAFWPKILLGNEDLQKILCLSRNAGCMVVRDPSNIAPTTAHVLSF